MKNYIERKPLTRAEITSLIKKSSYYRIGHIRILQPKHPDYYSEAVTIEPEEEAVQYFQCFDLFQAFETMGNLVTVAIAAKTKTLIARIWI